MLLFCDVMAPISGCVVRTYCEEGQAVKPGDPVLTIEIMKMTVIAKEAGIISFSCEQGKTVNDGQVLASIESLKNASTTLSEDSNEPEIIETPDDNSQEIEDEPVIVKTSDDGPQKKTCVCYMGKNTRSS